MRDHIWEIDCYFILFYFFFWTCSLARARIGANLSVCLFCSHLLSRFSMAFIEFFDCVKEIILDPLMANSNSTIDFSNGITQQPRLDDCNIQIMLFLEICELCSSQRSPQSFFFAAVNTLDGPLRKQLFTSTESKGHVCQLWLVDFDPFFFCFSMDHKTFILTSS